MDVRLGLDFGTHQTKACLNYQKGNQPKVYEFFRFDPEDDSSFFLPSRVYLLEDQTLRFGKYSGNSIQKEFSYFKIASAEDKKFRGVSGFNTEKEKYRPNRYGNVSPEILSILYLTWVIGYIKDNFTQKLAGNTENPKKGLIGRFLKKENKQEELKYHIQIGIPTEWSEKRNLWRRRKFEQILYLSCSLLDKTNTYKELCITPFEELKSKILDLFKDLKLKLQTRSWKEIIKEYNLSAFPETAAGLTCLVKEKNLPEGYYSAIDIGGGSSDISYFRVTGQRRIEYLASESILIASNNLYDSYAHFEHTKPRSTEQAHEYLENMRTEHPFELDKDDKYKEAFEKTFQSLNRRFYKIYNKRVYRHFRKEIANKKFDSHDCFVYGGGSLVHKPRHNPNKLFERILIHDQGNPNSLLATRTYANVRQLGTVTLPFEVKPQFWKDFSPLLLVPLGLSNVQPDENYDWNDRYYKPGEQTVKLDLEDPKLFDLVRRRWV